ncbi:MAG: hypothetical protein WC674_00770 [Candidatus Krumholzibacteriia bacterium]
MRKLLLAFATALLMPGMPGAATLGVYFDAPSKMADSPAPFSFSIGPHPDSGEIRGAFTPENDTQEESWGAIKSQYR